MWHGDRSVHERSLDWVGCSDRYVTSKLHAGEYGVHPRSVAFVPAAEMNDSVSHVRHAAHSRLLVSVGSLVVKAPPGQWLRVVVQPGGLVASEISPLDWNVPAGHVFQYCEPSSRRLPPGLHGVGWQLQLSATATHVSLVTTTWHTRSVVADSAAVSHSPATHTVSGAHSRLEYALFGTVSYSEPATHLV
jgi:hypothetical protein